MRKSVERSIIGLNSLSQRRECGDANRLCGIRLAVLDMQPYEKIDANVDPAILEDHATSGRAADLPADLVHGDLRTVIMTLADFLQLQDGE